MFWANGLRFEIVEDKFRKSPDKEIKLPKRASKGSMAYDFFSRVISASIPMKHA